MAASQGEHEYDTGGSTNGRIVERYSYTPYGQFVALKGDSGSGELGNLRPTSTVGNPFAHQGLPIDHEKASYQNRNREYVGQRFAQRDPLAARPYAPSGIQDGLSLYGYIRANPGTNRDPSGAASIAPPLDCEEMYGPCPPGYHYEGIPPACSCVEDDPTGGEDNPCKTEWECCACVLYAESGGAQGCYPAIVCVMKTRQRLSRDPNWAGHFTGEGNYCGQAESGRVAGVGNTRYEQCCEGPICNALERRSRENAFDACQAGCPSDPTGGAQYWGASCDDVVNTVGQNNIDNGNCVTLQVPGCTQCFGRCDHPPQQ